MTATKKKLQIMLPNQIKAKYLNIHTKIREFCVLLFALILF